MKKILLSGVVGLFFLPSFSADGPKSAEIKPYQGRLTIHVNGEPMTPMLYGLTHVFGGRWSWEEVARHNIRNFYKAGIRVFYLDIWLSDMWPKDRPGVLPCPGAVRCRRNHHSRSVPPARISLSEPFLSRPCL